MLVVVVVVMNFHLRNQLINYRISTTGSVLVIFLLFFDYKLIKFMTYFTAVSI